MTTAAAYPWENDPESVRAAKRAVEKHLLELGPEQGKEFIGSGIRVTAEFLRVANDIGQEAALEAARQWSEAAPVIILYFLDTIHTLGGLGEFSAKAAGLIDSDGNIVKAGKETQ